MSKKTLFNQVKGHLEKLELNYEEDEAKKLSWYERQKENEC